MKNTYSVAKAQANFTRILKEAEKHPISITRHDETVAFILSRDRMEAIVETLEIMANPEAVKTIREHQATLQFLTSLPGNHLEALNSRSIQNGNQEWNAAGSSWGSVA